MYTCESISGPLSASVVAVAAVPPVAVVGAAAAAVSVAVDVVSVAPAAVSVTATAAVSTACATVSAAGTDDSCENARVVSPIPTMNASTTTALNLLFFIKPISNITIIPI